MAGYFLVCPDTASLAISSSGVAECFNSTDSTSWELHSTDELNQLLVAFETVFSMPPLDELTVLMTAGFTTPMVAYMASRYFSELLNMLNPDYDKHE